MKIHRRIVKSLSSVSDALRATAAWKRIDLPPMRAHPSPPIGLTVAAVIKDEADFLAEWIDFHHFLGVDRFILYDNGSTDDTERVLAPYRRAGLVEMLPWRNFSTWLNQQRAAYAHAIANFGADTRWMGFFDIDEFMFAVDGRDLPVALERHRDVPALCVAGTNFGTGGHETRPPGSLLENFRAGVPMKLQRDVPLLVNTKCFVQPASIESIVSAHWFRIRGERARAFTEHGLPLMARPCDQAETMTVDTIRYNHYFSRSMEDFRRKIGGTDVRGSRYPLSVRGKQKMLDHIERLAVEDRAIDVVLSRWRAAASRDAAEPRAFRLNAGDRPLPRAAAAAGCPAPSAPAARP